MNNSSKERYGVNQLESKLLLTKVLKPDIPINDKTATFDGQVEVFSNDSEKKNDSVGLVDVQVKTTCNKKKCKRFSIERSTLTNFLQRDGAIFFVVYVDDDNNCAFFYRELHVFTILSFLRNSTGKRSITIDLQAFPEKNSEIVNLFLNFINTREMNKGAEKRNEIEKRLKGNFTRTDKTLSLHYIFTEESSEQDIIDYIFNHKAIAFETPYNFQFEVPVDEVQVESVTRKIPFDIRVDDTTFYNCFEKIYNKNSWEVVIGNCFHKYSNKDEILFTTEDLPMLSDRLHALSFMLALFRGHDFYIDGIKKQYPIVTKDYSEEIRTFQKVYDTLYTVKKFLEELKVTEDYDFSKGSLEEWNQLVTIATAFINHTTVDYNNSDGSDDLVTVIHAGNLYLGIHFVKEKDKRYFCKNLFEQDNLFSYVVEKSTKKIFRMSKYLKLEIEDFLLLSNIDFASIENSLFQYELTPINEELITLLILRMISAYDSSDSLRNDILESAQRISEKMIDHKNNQNCEIAKINLYQIISRKRNLLPKEIEELYELKKIYDNKDGQICIKILLHDFEAAEKIYATLNEDERINFSGYPICKLWGKEYDNHKLARYLPISSEKDII